MPNVLYTQLVNKFKENDLEGFKALLDGPNSQPNIYGNFGDPLIGSIISNEYTHDKIPFITVLINKGVDLEAYSSLGSPFEWAATHGTLAMVQLLLSDNRGSSDSINKMLLAACRRSFKADSNETTEIIKYLIESKGANVDYCNSNVSALMRAVEEGTLDVVVYLLSKQADLTLIKPTARMTPNPKKWTVLSEAYSQWISAIGPLKNSSDYVAKRRRILDLLLDAAKQYILAKANSGEPFAEQIIAELAGTFRGVYKEANHVALAAEIRDKAYLPAQKIHCLNTVFIETNLVELNTQKLIVSYFDSFLLDSELENENKVVQDALVAEKISYKH